MQADQQKIVDRIVAEMENGVLPWRQQFKASRSKTGLPYNAISGASYRGFNVVALLMTGYPVDGGWLTYKQAIAAGGHVRKGEKSTVIFYYKRMMKKKEKAGDKDEYFLMAKSYLVFHLSQCDEIDPAKLHKFPAVDNAPVDHKARNVEADTFVAAIPADITYSARIAVPHYELLGDKVNMPTFEQYKTADAFYSTLFHELTHWTGKRLRRDMFNKFGSEKYAIEELVAELTSCFTLPQFGMSNEKNSAAYLKGWIKVLKETPNVLTKIASEAAKANAFLNAFSSHDASEPDEESGDVSEAA